MHTTRLLTLILLLLANPVGPAFADEPALSDEDVASATYYKRAFSIEPDAFLNAIGLDRKAISPPTVSFPGPYGSETSVGSGVLAPDPQAGPPAFLSLSKVEKAVNEFFSLRGVDLSTGNSPSNFVFFIPQTRTLHAHGSLRHLQLVDSILKQLNGVLIKEG